MSKIYGTPYSTGYSSDGASLSLSFKSPQKFESFMMSITDGFTGTVNVNIIDTDSNKIWNYTTFDFTGQALFWSMSGLGIYLPMKVQNDISLTGYATGTFYMKTAGVD